MIGDFVRGEVDGDVVFVVFGEARLSVAFMGPWRATEVPGVIGIAPLAVEVAARAANEDGRLSGGDAFALDAVENFRLVVEFGEFQGSVK